MSQERLHAKLVAELVNHGVDADQARHIAHDLISIIVDHIHGIER